MKILSKIGLLLLITLSIAACAPDYSKYQAMTACDKEADIWEKITTSQYETLPEWTGSEIGPLLMRVMLDPLNIFGIVREYVRVTVSLDRDVSEPNRKRSIHTFGSVAKIKFVAAANQPFTGLYKGVECGVARLSVAAMPSDNGMTPGLGMKFLIDGKPSANFVAMNSLEEQQGFNFFEKDFSSQIEVPADNAFLNFGLSIFELVTKDGTLVDVAFMAELETNGDVISTANADAPWILKLEPNPAFNFSQEKHEYRDDLNALPANTLLYKVYGKRRNENNYIFIGDVITKSTFVSSKYGDEDLFFRHDTVDDRL